MTSDSPVPPPSDPSTPADAAAASPLAGLRDGRDDDSAALIALVGGVFDEYPGCVLDLDDLDADLLAPVATIAASGGAWWVLPAPPHTATPHTPTADAVPPDVARPDTSTPNAAAAGQQVLMATIGCSAVVDGEVAELKRLYVAAAFRQRGLGRALVEHVEAHASAGGASAIELWSDTRFADAHRLYERLGYTATGETRELHDPSDTTEYRFVRHLGA